jgi:hypothetical protein
MLKAMSNTTQPAGNPATPAGGAPLRIVCIIDRSGSMESIREPAISGFNQFLREQRDIEIPTELSLVLFDDQYEMPIQQIDLRKVPDLTASTFVPRGSTALLDAIGRTIASATALGMAHDSAVNFSSDSDGTKMAMDCMSERVVEYRRKRGRK